MHYIISTGGGLSRRLIEAESPEEAKVKFLFLLCQSDEPRYQRRFTVQHGEIDVHLASSDDIAAFVNHRRGKAGPDQLAFDAPGMGRIEKPRRGTPEEVGL